MEFNFTNTSQNNGRESRDGNTPGNMSWSPKSPLGVIVILAIIAIVGGFTYFNSHSKPLVSSGVSEDLKIERIDGARVQFDKKFTDKSVKPDYGSFIWTSDKSGSCEPVITKATWDRTGKFVTLTKTSGTGCLLTKHRFQQKISPVDGSKFPSDTRIVYVNADQK